MTFIKDVNDTYDLRTKHFLITIDASIPRNYIIRVYYNELLCNKCYQKTFEEAVAWARNYLNDVCDELYSEVSAKDRVVDEDGRELEIAGL